MPVGLSSSRTPAVFGGDLLQLQAQPTEPFGGVPLRLRRVGQVVAVLRGRFGAMAADQLYRSIGPSSFQVVERPAGDHGDDRARGDVSVRRASIDSGQRPGVDGSSTSGARVPSKSVATSSVRSRRFRRSAAAASPGSRRIASASGSLVCSSADRNAAAHRSTSWARTCRRSERIRRRASTAGIVSAARSPSFTPSVSYGLTSRPARSSLAAPVNSRQQQHPAAVHPAGDVLLGDQVHPVPQRRHRHDVGGHVERGQFLPRQRLVQVVHGGVADLAVVAVQRADLLLDLPRACVCRSRAAPGSGWRSAPSPRPRPPGRPRRAARRTPAAGRRCPWCSPAGRPPG